MTKLLPVLIVLGITWRLAAQTTTTFIPLGSAWRYLDNGTNQGTAWRAAGFDDSAWSQGAAELGYGDNDEATVVSYGPNASSKYITTYFRKSFTVTNAAAYTTAAVRVRRDDGVVVYLNGTEIFRSNMPAGTITHTTLASSAAADEVTLFSGAVNAALLVEGANVIAAEIHQNAASSSDLSFELDFQATIPGTTPAATPQSVTVTEDTPKAITLSGTDPQSDPLTFTIASQPANGVLTGTPPNITYTPNANFAANDSFTFTASDGSNTSPAAAVTITVAAVNDPPVADVQSQTLPEDGSITFDVTGSDVESAYGMLPHYTQQLYNSALAITDGLSGATWNANTGTLFLIRNDSAGGGHSYECNMDGTVLRTITQSGFVDTEAIAWMYGDTYAIAEENNNQRISIVTIPPGATTLSRTAAGNVTWTTSVGNLQNLGIECLCYDAGRDVLYYLCEKPAGGSWPVYVMNPQTGVSTILCDLNATILTAGVATDLSDMAFDRATDTILLLSHESNKIIRVNRSGAVLEQRGFAQALTQAEMLALTPDRLRLFVGGEPRQFARYALPAATLTYQIITPPAHGSLSGIPPRVTYTPVPNFSGTDSFTFRVHDGTVNSADATVTLSVTPANDPPSGSGVSTSAEATEATPIILPVSDADGDELTIQTTAPSFGTIAVVGTTVTYTGNAGYTGPDSFTYTVSDGTLTVGPFTVNIEVIPFNVAPVTQDQLLTLNEDSSQPVLLAASDAENNPLIWTIVSPPAHGTLSGAAPNLTYTPDADYHGPDSFTFRVYDGQENSNTATVSLTISPVNDAPVAAAAAATVEAGYSLPLTLAGADADGDALTFAIVAPPAHGTLSGAAPNLTYTADIAHSGEDTIAFTVGDGILTSAPAIVTINVAPYNLPPVASSGSGSTDEDTPVAVSLVASDPESAPLTYQIVTPPASGTLTGTAPNLSYTPGTNFSGSDSFSWTASDGSKTSLPVTFSLTITPVNDAPAAQSLSVPTETGIPAPVILTGSDVENDPLAFTVVAPPISGTLTGTAPALTYTPAPGYTGADSFSYKVNDGALDSALATVSITINAPALDNLISSGAAWKYFANGSNQGTTWRAPSFDDSAWSQGPAQLGYGDGDEATVVPYGPDANNRYVTTYFRRDFQVPNPGVLTGPLKLDVLRDDGAVVYLNGTEVFRTNMPAGTIAYNTLAPASVAAADESSFFSTTFSSSLIVPGRNVLAVEVHQNTVNSSDVSFDLKLYETIPSITRGPYVQMTGTDRATVRWRTNVAVSSVLNYGTVEGLLATSVTDAALKTEHEIHITGLTPDTRYFYSAGYPLATFVSGPTYYFTTHPPVDTVRPYRFWVLGDAGTGTASQTGVRDAFYAWNGTTAVDGVLLLGDNVYDTGTDAEYQTKFFDIYPARLRNTTFWPAFGNHDAGNASSSTQSGPYYNSFTMPKFAEAGGVASGTEAYYSFDYGNIHFVCLDSEGSSLLSNGAMAQWLQADLAANWREWTVAFWHHPVYSKGSHDSDNPAADSGKMKNMREVFVPILESYGVDLLLFGHEHAYFRSKFVSGHYGTSATFNDATMLKQSGMGDPAVDGPYMKVDGPNNGAVFTVAGSSGKLDSLARSMPVLALHLNELGSVVLDVNGRELTSRFLNNSGTVRDTFRIVHNSPPVALAATVSGDEDNLVPVVLGATDSDNDPLTWEIVTPPTVGSLAGTAPNLTFTPPADFHGSASLEFRVHDGRVNSAPVTVMLNIAPVNDAPQVAAGSSTTAEDTGVAVTLAGSDADGDALSWTITAPPAHGSLSGTPPALIYTPDADWHGTDSFEFTASDGTLVSGSAAFALTVTPVNDLPVAAAQSLTTLEDTAIPLDLAAADLDGDALTYTVTAPPSNGILSGTAPNLIYTPAADFSGTDSFEFTASDQSGSSLVAVVTVSVTPVNDTPLALAQTLTTDEDTGVTLALGGTDAENDMLTFTILTPPEHGILSGSAPDLVYTPAENYHGADSFAFTVADASAASLPASVSITVTPVNDAPVAAAQSLTGSEDTPRAVTVAATDADGDTLTYTITTPPAHGTLSGTAPDLIYTPDANWHGTDSFAFSASDASATSTPATVTLDIAPVNDPPVVSAQSLTTDEDTVLPVTLEGVDDDGDPLTFTVTVPPLHGTVSGTPPSLNFTPQANWHGTDTFTFIAGDGTADSAPAVVTITVAAVNDPPAATALDLVTTEDTAVNLTLGGTDPDGDTVTALPVTLPAHGTLTGTLPEVIYTPEENWHGTDSFTYAVTDGPAVSAPVTVTVTVTPVNDRPVATAQSLTGTEDTDLSVTLAATDTDGDALTFVITLPPAHGTLSGVAPNLTYTPAPDWLGLDSFSFTASDGTESSLPAAVTIEIAPANDAPIAAAGSAVTAEDSAAAVTLNGSDPDGDTVAFVVTSPPVHGTLSGTAPDLIYTPAADWHGSDSFTFIVNDGIADSAQAVFSIEVTPVNDAPAATPQTLSTDEDSPLPVVLAGTDVENDSLAFAITAPPAHGTLSGSVPNLTYLPDPNYHGTDSFAFTAADATATSAPAFVSIVVEQVNDAPVAAAQSLTGSEDTAVPVTVSAADADGDALTYTVTVPPAHGVLTGAAPDFIYTPAPNWHGSDAFSFTASDGIASSAAAPVEIAITSVNDSPLATAGAASAAEDTAVAITLTGSDPDGDTLSFTVISDPAHGTLSGTAPDFIFTPAADWHGTDSIEFTVSDGAVVSPPAVFTVTVTPVNDLPVAAAQSLATDEDTSLPVTLSAADADGEVPAFTVTSLPAHGTLTGTAPHLTYTPAENYHGQDSFAFQASDGTGDGAPAVVSISVTPVNDAPAAGPITVETTEDAQATLLLSGSDADGDALSFVILSQPANGTLSGTAPNLVFTPTPNWHGTDSFSYAVTDGPAVSLPALATVIVTPVNDRPSAAGQSLIAPEDTTVPILISATDPDGDTLTYAISLAPAHGTLSGTPPNLIYTPSPDWNGLDSFSFTASDGVENSLPVAVTLEITPSPDAPVALSQSIAANEDTAVNLTLGGTDPDGEALTFSIATSPSQGVLSGVAPDLIYTPLSGWSGSDSFSFTVSDGTATSAAATVGITVQPVNDAPVAYPATVTVPVNLSANITLQAADVENDTLSWEILSPPLYGVLSGTAPSLTYTPNLAFSGSDSFTFRVSDGTVNSDPAAVTLNVNSSGPWQMVARTGVVAPGAGGATFTVLQPDFVSDAAGRATFRGTAGSITGIWTEGPAGLEPAILQGTAAPGAAGAVFDAVTAGPWAAGDGELLLYGRLLAGTGGVTAANDFGYWLRSGNSTALVAREGTAPPSLPGTARFNALSSVATLQPGGNYVFAASLVTNAGLGITTANDTGLWGTFGAPQRLLVRENSAAPGSADGGVFDTLTTAGLTSNGIGQFGFTGAMKIAGSITTANCYGLWLWDPAQFGLVARGGHAAPGTAGLFAQPLNPSLGGSFAFRATLSTASGGVTTSNDTGLWSLDAGTLNLLAREGTQAPGVAAGGNFSGLTEGAAMNDSGELAFRATLANGGGVNSSNNTGVWVRSRFTANAVALTARKGTIAPGAGAATFASFDYPQISPEGRELFTATLTQNAGTGVTAANDRGLWVRTYGVLTLALREGDAFTLAPGDVRTLANVTLPAAPAAGRTPLSQQGRLLVLLTFTDGSTALYHYTLPQNVPPAATTQSLTAVEDTALPVVLSGTDADGDALTFTVTAAPAGGVLTGNAPNLTYTPAPNWSGTDVFTFTVSDGKDAPVSAQVTITVMPVNDAPVAGANSVITPEDTPLAVTLSGSDVEGSALGFSIVTPPAHGTLTGTAPALMYQPDENYHGPDSFVFVVNDGAEDSAPAIVSIDISAVNDAPVAVPLNLSSTEDTPIPLTLDGTDADGDALTCTVTVPPAHGVLSGTLPHLTYTPNPNWHGTDSFSFTVSDGLTTSAPDAVILSIASVNDVPAAHAASVRTEEDLPVQIDLTGADPDGDALTFTVVVPPVHGTLGGTAPNLTYTPAPDWQGTDTFSFVANDGTDISPPAAVTIAVRPVNAAPVASAQSAATEEDTPLPVLLTATDAEGDALTFTITALPAQGTLSGTPPAVTYSPAANWSGTDSFSFTASDGEESSAPAIVTVTVTPVNDTPAATPVEASTEVGIPMTITLPGSDVEGSALSWNVVTPPVYGTLEGAGALRTYSPNLAWSGVDQFTFTVSDGDAVSAPVTATLTVASSGPWQLVARTGNAAPGAGGAAFSALQTDFVSDAAGRASFRATAGAITGIWTKGINGLEPAIMQSAAAPGATGAVFDVVTTGPWAAGDGELLLYGKLLAGTGGVTTSNDLGYWLRNSGSTTLVAREDGTVPSFAAAARFNTLAAVATLQPGGNYVYAGTLRTNSTLGITTANDTGLWGTFGAPQRLLVRENSAATGSADGGVFDTLTTAGLTSNASGQFGFTGAMKIAGSITTANCYGLWLWDPAQFGLVARGGHAAPGTAGLFAQPLNPSLGGSFAFRATLSTASGGVTTSNDTGLWSLDAGTLNLLAREGTQAPGVAAGGNFSGLTEGAAMNDSGELAFRATLASGGGVSGSNNAGLWVRSRFTANAVSLTARKGTIAPGAGAATFASFDYPLMADDGREAFTATLTQNAGTGVTATNDRGLWVRNTAGTLALVLREGSTFLLAPGDVRTVSAVTLPASQASARTPFSDDGRLLVLIGFTDGTSALYQFALP